MGKFSAEYYTALAEAAQHHVSNKTYSGKFLRPHAPFIKEIIDRLGCRSVLDYGCGKGAQYTWVSHSDDSSIPSGQTIEGFWGLSVWKYDPAVVQWKIPPAGTFDLVICTHVLGSIPIIDLSAVLGEILGYANKAVYVAEKLGPVGKRVFSADDRMPRHWAREDWEAALRLSGTRSPKIEIHLSTRQRVGNQVLLKREKL